jgi:hypothetical protein
LWAAGGRPRPVVPRRRSGRSRSGCPARRPRRGSWCSVRRAAPIAGPRQLLGAGAMLMGAHIGACRSSRIRCRRLLRMLEHPPDTTFAQRLNQCGSLSLTEPLGRSRHGILVG